MLYFYIPQRSSHCFYNDAVFLYTLEFQSPLTTMKEIASTQAILLQENEEADTIIEVFEKKSTFSTFKSGFICQHK